MFKRRGLLIGFLVGLITVSIIIVKNNGFSTGNIIIGSVILFVCIVVGVTLGAQKDEEKKKIIKEKTAVFKVALLMPFYTEANKIKSEACREIKVNQKKSSGFSEEISKSILIDSDIYNSNIENGKVALEEIRKIGRNIFLKIDENMETNYLCDEIREIRTLTKYLS